MVFYAFVLAMRLRDRKYTAEALKEIAVNIYNAGGMIRRLSNEGIMRPYCRFRDIDNSILTYARYITLQIDLGEEMLRGIEKTIREHPDVFITLRLHNLERPIGMKNQVDFFPLDTFCRLEEEINWPPQVSEDIYDMLDKNWKEFSRTRWSNYLKS